MEDALATRSGPRSVGATLRARDSASIALGVRAETSMAAQREREADRDRQQASLRKELRKSDAARSELRSEVCEHREKAQRVAAELWRLDGERARTALLEAEKQRVLQAERDAKHRAEMLVAEKRANQTGNYEPRNHQIRVPTAPGEPVRG